ncbi:MAG TPA: hypothetical protein VKP30_32655 [Polyangiaceae bacterium]|nr:hypothetical protein [Polyangiaceae bacterium]
MIPVHADTELRVSTYAGAGLRAPGGLVDYGDLWGEFDALVQYTPRYDGCGTLSGRGHRALAFTLGPMTQRRLDELSSITRLTTNGAHWLYCPLAESPQRIFITLSTFDGIERWTPELLARFEAIDPRRYCLDIEALMVDSREAPLPSGIECLIISHGVSRSVENEKNRFAVNAALASLRNLRYLSIHNAGSVDLELVANNAALELLDIAASTQVTSVGALGKLRRLRSLKLRGRDDIKNFEFLAQLRELRFLDLRRAKVKSLRPIEAIASLVDVYADDSTVSVLPRRHMPNLRVFHVMSRDVPAEEVQQFSMLNPQVEIWHRWSDTLPRLLQGITRIKIGDIEVTDEKEIRRFKKLLEIEERGAGWDCRCEGRPWIELFRGEEPAGTLAVYHGVAIRWREEWPSGVFLGYEQSQLLVDWLESHWIIEPKAERQQHFESWPPE